MMSEYTPAEVREGVRSGILDAIERDVELRGGRAAQLLLAAGVVGVAGALAVTLLLSPHPFDHHPAWHIAVFSAVWSGLLVVGFAIAFLGVRTPSLPLASSASVAILGLGIAGVCGVMCPDPHFLQWWRQTGVGASVSRAGGYAAGALCFGVVTSLFLGAASGILVLSHRRRSPVRPILPAGMLLVLLAPGVALQSIDTSWGVFFGWLAGIAAGGYLGVAGAVRVRALSPARPGTRTRGFPAAGGRDGRREEEGAVGAGPRGSAPGADAESDGAGAGQGDAGLRVFGRPGHAIIAVRRRHPLRSLDPCESAPAKPRC